MAVQPLITTGRRKTSVARVRLVPGKGKLTVNGKEIAKYFFTEEQRVVATEPLDVTHTRDKYDIAARITGGGLYGQAEALAHGIARALLKADPASEQLLKAYVQPDQLIRRFLPNQERGLARIYTYEARALTRDSRMKERKKPAKHGARRGQQYSKR